MVNADLAMYDAKEAGRDRWARYRTDEHDRPKILSRRESGHGDQRGDRGRPLRAARAADRPLAGSGPAQYELLLRMRDRHGDLIPPGSFIYIAERLGLIGEIDRWVTARAIDMLAEQRALGRDLRFEVNLSGHTIGDHGLLELVERRLRNRGVPADRLDLRGRRDSGDRQHRSCQRLRRTPMPISDAEFALDDFGARPRLVLLPQAFALRLHEDRR